MPPTNAGYVLLPIARAAIEQTLSNNKNATGVYPEWVHEKGACFVTLQQDGQLRGCIGTIEAYRPLIEDVWSNAISAAMRDPRFPPLQQNDLQSVHIELSLLSACEPIYFRNEADALSQLRPGIDGVVFEWQGRRSTFLPQVWSSLEIAAEFISHLKAKAGLAPNFWAEDVNLYRYTVSKWTEDAL